MNKPSLNVVKGVPPKTLERSSGAYQGLLKDITALYEDAQKRADTAVKKIILKTYWGGLEDTLSCLNSIIISGPSTGTTSWKTFQRI